MYTDYLKSTLQRIADLKLDSDRIRCTRNEDGAANYPAQCGALDALVFRSATEAESALKWTVDHVEPAEREGARLVSILEALGIELDEETLATLELIGVRTYDDKSLCETSRYRHDRNQITNLISNLVASVQYDERDIEHDGATEALLAAGFEYDEEEDAFRREAELVRITLVNGRESRYEWEYETSEPVHEIESGKSGEFSRLLALIVPKVAEVVQ